MKPFYYSKNLIRSIFLVLLSFFSAHFATAQSLVTATSTISTTRCGATSPITLETTAPDRNVPKPICSSPDDLSGVPPVALSSPPFNSANFDDTTVGPVPIGFTFNFYGLPYTTAIIQTNGIVGFPPFSNGFGGYYTQWIPVSIPVPPAPPNTGVPNNYIAGMFADFYLAAGGSIRYATLGTAPNRRFVVYYKDMVPFVGAGATGTASFQIVLNENGTFQVIIMYLSANWFSTSSFANATCGSENIDGTITDVTPGRNNEDWITNGVDMDINVPGSIPPVSLGCPPGTTPNLLFESVVPVFVNWTDAATSAVISPLPTFNINPRPTVTTTYRANWRYGTKVESKDVTITVVQPTTILSANNINCTSTGNATINLTTNLVNGGGYVLSYLLNGVPGSTAPFAITGTSGTSGALTGTASITGLAAGTYTGFSLTKSGSPISLGAGCSLILPTTIVIDTKLAKPTVDPVSLLNCPNTSITLKNSETSVAGTTIKWYDAPNGGGTLVGTGATVNVFPLKTTKYYVRRENATCNPSDDNEIEVDVRKFVIYPANGSTSTTYCTDRYGWNHFYNLADEIIFSVKPSVGDLSAGIPQVTINVSTSSSYQLPGVTPPNCAAPADEKFEMARSWNFSLGSSVPLGTTYSIRFYHDPAERTNAEIAANNWKIANPSCNYGYKYTNSASPDFATNTGFYWFKNTAGNYSTPMYDGLHLSGATSDDETGDTANYVELTGITSFSGGSGAVILVPPVVPLPVTLLSFSGKRINSNQVKLTWETVAEVNNAGFEVEFATDARNFEKVGFQPAQGNSKTVATYQQNINNTIGGYFRLKQIDKDKKYNYSKIIYIDGTNDAVIRIYPNPTKDNLTIDLGELKATDEIKATFRNVLGVLVKELSLTQTQTEISLGSLPKGIYMLKIIRNGKMIVEKVVLQ